jgi:alpha-glucosidase
LIYNVKIMTKYRTLLACITILAMNCSVFAKSFDVLSPSRKLKLTVSYDEALGTLSYGVTSGQTVIFTKSPLGITTDKADFTSGLQLVKDLKTKIDETYTLPQGKVSRYHNKANERTLLLKKGDEKVELIFRVYDDGIAFRYAIPGSGKIQISKEASGFNIAGEPDYWGQEHPNKWGYESILRKLGNENALSLALLCEMKKSKHWVLLAQAATYGTYCLPHLTREDSTPNLLKFTFPNDQKEPLKTRLPFESPWRVAVISPNDLSTIVEQTLFENLNPPTEPELQNADWIKPGRSSWDWFAGDKENWKGWIDFIDEMDWEYHLVDAGWDNYIKDPVAMREYAESKGRGVMAWQHLPSMNKPEKIENALKKYSEIGFKGAKVDFFDRLPDGKIGGDDYEDTQMGIQVRDTISQLAAKYKIQIVFHGCAIPTGERRRWPHLLGTEAIKGQEGNPSAEHDNCIAFIRNPLGSVDYSPVWFGKGGKTDAYQLATSIIFESGFLIFADLHRDYLGHQSKEILKKIPASWDETRFIEGYPASHTVIARRKGKQWFIGGFASKQKTVNLSFDFLERKEVYSATLFKDQKSGSQSTLETKELRRGDSMEVHMLERGGFVLLLESVEK